MLDVNWKPQSNDLRAFGKGFLVLFVLIGTAKALWSFFSLGAIDSFAIGMIGVGIVGGLWCISGHASARVVYWLWMGFGFVLGFFVSKIMFAVFYFGIITPLALLFRVIGRDRLILRKPAGATFWNDLPRKDSGYDRLF